MGFDAVINEIKSGGIQGCLGIDQFDWGGSAGKIYEFWKCEPCCGSPMNPKDAIYCMFCWYCCPLCTESKFFASALNQECALVPHILCVWCVPNIAAVCLRYNLRKGNGVKGNMCGDFVCMHCLPCCAHLQELRSKPISSWDLMPVKIPGIVAPQVKLCL